MPVDAMAMGDNNAVEIGQKAHMQIGLASQLFLPQSSSPFMAALLVARRPVGQ